MKTKSWINVVPLPHISLQEFSGRWEWAVVDMNAESNNRDWKLAGAEDYDTPEDALADAVPAYMKAQAEAKEKFPRY